jgi:hypothetical protein
MCFCVGGMFMVESRIDRYHADAKQMINKNYIAFAQIIPLP